MLAKIAPRFVIAGVIQNAYYANYMTIEVAKQIFGDSCRDFRMEDSKRYNECNFFGYLSTLPAPTEFTSQYEAEKYEEAVQKFAEYNDVKALYSKLNEFTLEVKELYRTVEANNTSSNFFSRGDKTDSAWEEDVNDSLTRYEQLLKDLEPYPEWRNKVIDNVGRWFLLIHNNLAESDFKISLFSKLNRHDYFV